MRSVITFSLEARPSRYYAGGLIALGAGVIVALALTDLPVWLAVMLGLLTVAGLIAAWRQHVRALPRHLSLRADARCFWRDSLDGREREARIVEAALLGPLVALTLAPAEGGSLRLAYWVDMLPADAWRALRTVARGLPLDAKDSHGV